MDFLLNFIGSGAYVSIDVATCNINEHITDKLGVLFPNRWRSGSIADVRQQGNRHLSACRRRNENTLKAIEITPEIAGIAHTDRVAFTAFYSRCDCVPTDGTLNDLIYILDPKTVPGGRLPVHTEIK